MDSIYAIALTKIGYRCVANKAGILKDVDVSFNERSKFLSFVTAVNRAAFEHRNFILPFRPAVSVFIRKIVVPSKFNFAAQVLLEFFTTTTNGSTKPRGSYTEDTVEKMPLLIIGFSFMTIRNLETSDSTHHWTPSARSIGRVS